VALYLHPQCVFIAWCLVKHRDKFTFTFTKDRICIDQILYCIKKVLCHKGIRQTDKQTTILKLMVKCRTFGIARMTSEERSENVSNRPNSLAER